MDAHRSEKAGSESPTLASMNGSVDAKPHVMADATVGGEPPVAIKSEKLDPDHNDPVLVSAELELTKIMSTGEGIVYPKGVKLAIITMALCLAVFLVALDNTIIATAIPKITDEFHSLPDVGWYASAYLLTTAAFQLLFGKLYTFFSIKYVFLAAIGIFEVGSVVCGAAPNSTALIIGRAVAGLGSAGIFSGALIIVAFSVPLQVRPIYTGIIGAVYGVSSVVGPLMGGAFTDKVTWRWCFYINLPIGAVTAVVIFIFFQPPQRQTISTLTWRQRANQLDLLGTFFFMPAIVCLLLALQWGGSMYPWSNGRIIALFVLFGVLISAFIAVQFWKGDYATVPIRIFVKRSIWAACIFSFTLGGAFFIALYYIPIWFQAIQGVTAVESGIRSLPLVLGLVILSLVAGGTVTALGYYTPWMIASAVFSSIGLGLITTWTPSAGSGHWIGYQALAGMGVGMGLQQTMIAVQTVLDIADVPIGTSLVIFVQTLGGSLMVSVAQNIFTNKLVSGVVANIPGLDPQFVLGVGATSIQTAIPPQYLNALTLVYNDALTSTFIVSTALAAASIVGALAIEWKSVKGKKIEMAAA